MPPANRHNPERAKSSQSLYSLHEFLREFPDDNACLEYLWRERHSQDGENAHCPKCDQTRKFKRYATKQRRQSWTCLGCGHHIHPTAGTIFEKSSRPLSDWFYVMFLVSSSRCGVAAKQIERELGCNYKTAWRMLNKVRNELMEQDDEPLSGEVEVDETFMGRKPRASDMKRKEALGLPRKATVTPKVTVLAAVERGGRIRASVIPSSRGWHLNPTVRKFVLPGSMIFTDEWYPYRNLAGTYTHRRIRHRQSIYVEGNVHTQTVEGFFGHFKNDVRGTHHSISRRWLDSYLNEWVWKWNHRKDDEAMFRQLLTSATA
jgi:transposase